MTLEARAAGFAALGESRRLSIVDQLAKGDRTVAELAASIGMNGNLLAHHLDVLEAASLIRRRVSEGDHRRRYVSLRWDQLPSAPSSSIASFQSVAFVCTHNSARSQFAAALWKQTTGGNAVSGGSHPAVRVHAKAVQVALEFGVDISGAKPAGYAGIRGTPDLVVTVCDRARESNAPLGRENVHWSIPDPVLTGRLQAFRSAFEDIAHRLEHLGAGQQSVHD